MNGMGLVLEGGGMRGIYTAGVLDYFLEQNIEIPYVIGVSAGACMGTSYLSKQHGRNKRVNTEFLQHPDYISFKNLIRNKQLFGMDLLFDIIPNELDPFDFNSFYNAEQKFVVGTTDCVTGEPVYFDKDQIVESTDMLNIIRASSSLPLMAPIIQFHNHFLMDGGIADPIPIGKSEADGNLKNIVVLTRNAGYRKKSSKGTWYLQKKYKDYPGLVQAVLKRYEVYNKQLEYIEEQEKAGNILVIRPVQKLKVGRIERNKGRLLELYKEGYEDAKRLREQILGFISYEKTTC
ncbi:patatin-like phospholipase family protein [Gottfriedia acidiceleris]|uniref:Patatin family protein n=1 Tax=Gottfriedia acidiceleris TaxID=371036 RepID=A0ABY4JIK3_9BACI|nr:patatin family protein [Gottfriedia acidiceleris]UPM53670.1 patatin family protein [Gottfriedia acidiceleris]